MKTGIALGSNVGDRLANLRAARDAVLALSGVGRHSLSSSVYETEPIECAPGAPLFLNAVIEIDQAGDPAILLRELLDIERQLGRPSKHPRNAPRPIDLDVLYAGDLQTNGDEIIIPHPRMNERRFVLAPLAEIRPTLVLPGQSRTVAELLEALSDNSAVTKVSGPL